MKYSNPRTGLAVLRCGRDEWRRVFASATLVTHIKGRALALHLRRVSGTHAAAKTGALLLSSQLCAQLGGRAADEEEVSRRAIDAALAVT